MPQNDFLQRSTMVVKLSLVFGESPRWSECNIISKIQAVVSMKAPVMASCVFLCLVQECWVSGRERERHSCQIPCSVVLGLPTAHCLEQRLWTAVAHFSRFHLHQHCLLQQGCICIKKDRRPLSTSSTAYGFSERAVLVPLSSERPRRFFSESPLLPPTRSAVPFSAPP